MDPIIVNSLDQGNDATPLMIATQNAASFCMNSGIAEMNVIDTLLAARAHKQIQDHIT